MFPKLDQAKKREDFVAASAFLKARPECTGKIGAVGFCYGGGMVNFLATRLGADLSAGVPFYRSSPELTDVAKIRAPLIVQSAETDARTNASWPAFEEALKAAKVSYERHVYAETQHGLNSDTTPRYDAVAAQLAWGGRSRFLISRWADRLAARFAVGIFTFFKCAVPLRDSGAAILSEV